MFRHANRPAVFHGGVPSCTVSLGMAKDTAGENNDVIPVDLEVCIPAGILGQTLSQRLRQVVSHLVR